MYLKHFYLNYPPFSNEPDPEIFFQGARRGEISHALIEDIIGGKPLVRVIGEKGTGKTQLCKCLLRHPIGRDFDLVYLDDPVGSLNDLLYGVCVNLGMSAPVSSDHDMLAELQSLLHKRKDCGKRVLLIIDEAEKLFLAALERLMRVICESGEDHILHVLLVGRPTLVEHLEQLTAYCSDVDVLSGYTLHPLSLEETHDYLQFCLAEAASRKGNQEKVFNQETEEKIFSVSGGNIRKINLLADKSMQTACLEHSSFVSPEHVESPKELPRRNSTRLKKPSIALTRKNGIIAGSILAFFVMLFLLFSGNEDKKKEDIVAIPEQKVAVQQESSPEVIIPVVEEPQAPVDLPPKREIEKTHVEEIKTPLAKVVEPTAAKPEEPEIVELRPERVKINPEKVVQKIVIIEPPSKTSVVKPPLAPVNQIRVSPLGEQIFQERIRASAKWLANGYRNRYTVQMMMLVSEQAAPNIKRMLAEQKYQAIKDYLYILTKKTSPPTLFVFYGTYDSMEQARQARNNMPLFLRKHHPYALSINDAMKKTED